jgi:uroporphyrin-III C-methyltransferase
VSKPENTKITDTADTEDTVIPVESELAPENPLIEEAIATEAAHRANWLSILVAVMALAGSGAVGWMGWQEIQVLRNEITASSTLAPVVTRLEGRVDQHQSQFSEIQQQVNALAMQIERTESRNQSVIDRVESVAEQLARAQVDTRTSYTLAEAEYLLKLADQRLLIERNPETAIVLMQTSQALLGQLEDGRLLPVREQLAADVQALSSVERIDVLGMQAELLALDSVLESLELPVRRLRAIEAEQTDAAPMNDWLQTLSEFIRIREVDAPIAPLVTAADAGRAREVLRLSLEQIKVAMIREDQALFDASVSQAIRITQHFFSTVEGAGLRVMQTLEQLAGQKVVRPIPDASAGLRALQAFRQAEVSRRAIANEVQQ